MADIIQLRRGTAAQWTAANPILADGEVGWEKDTNKKKTGNGIDAWNDLPYESSGGTSRTILTSIPTGAVTFGVETFFAGAANGESALVTLPNGGEFEIHLTGGSYTINNETITAESAVLVNAGGTYYLFTSAGRVEAPPVAPVKVTPAAPTNGIVNDNADTFAFTPTTGYAVTAHEYTTTGGASWTPVTTNPISVGNVSIAANQFGVRVAESPTNFPSAVLWSNAPFTATPPPNQLAAPTINKVTRSQDGWYIFASYPPDADKLWLLGGATLNPQYSDVGSDITNLMNQPAIQVNAVYGEAAIRVTDSTATKDPSQWVELGRPATFNVLGDTTITDDPVNGRVYVTFPTDAELVAVYADGVIKANAFPSPGFVTYGQIGTAGTYTITAFPRATGYDEGGYVSSIQITIP